ncbi:unnamed protein product [Clavelina lepadiformis]|uniref:Uncharacterized protein n=1 Tax=Clavelina lepadiformis TaxID=159417 RepID=A0ABP0G348_CLALP
MEMGTIEPNAIIDLTTSPPRTESVRPSPVPIPAGGNMPQDPMPPPCRGVPKSAVVKAACPQHPWHVTDLRPVVWQLRYDPASGPFVDRAKVPLCNVQEGEGLSAASSYRLCREHPAATSPAAEPGPATRHLAHQHARGRFDIKVINIDPGVAPDSSPALSPAATTDATTASVAWCTTDATARIG